MERLEPNTACLVAERLQHGHLESVMTQRRNGPEMEWSFGCVFLFSEPVSSVWCVDYFRVFRGVSKKCDIIERKRILEGSVYLNVCSPFLLCFGQQRNQSCYI